MKKCSVDQNTGSQSSEKVIQVFFKHQLTLIHELKFTIHELKMGVLTDSSLFKTPKFAN